MENFGINPHEFERNKGLPIPDHRHLALIVDDCCFLCYFELLFLKAGYGVSFCSGRYKKLFSIFLPGSHFLLGIADRFFLLQRSPHPVCSYYIRKQRFVPEFVAAFSGPIQ